MTPSICQCRDGNTLLVWSRRLKPEVISRCWRSAIAARYVRISVADVTAGLATLRVALLQALGRDRATV